MKAVSNHFETAFFVSGYSIPSNADRKDWSLKPRPLDKHIMYIMQQE